MTLRALSRFGAVCVALVGLFGTLEAAAAPEGADELRLGEPSAEASPSVEAPLASGTQAARRAVTALRALRLGGGQEAADETIEAAKADLETAYGQGDLRAALWLARLAEDDELTLDQFRTVAERLARAAVAGDAKAALYLSEAIRASGQSADQPRGLRLLTQAADAGLPEARAQLGLAYRFGQGVEQDLERAAQLLRDASRSGAPEAQLHYGVMLVGGQGVEKDEAAGAALLRAAAIRGNKIAQNRLARLHSRGIGVPLDPYQTAFWHLLAREGNGEQDGVSDPVLDGFLASVPAQDLRRARAAATAFNPSPTPADAPSLLALPGFPGMPLAGLFPPA